MPDTSLSYFKNVFRKLCSKFSSAKCGIYVKCHKAQIPLIKYFSRDINIQKYWFISEFIAQKTCVIRLK